MSSKIAMIVNPNAGNGSTGAKWPWIRHLAGKYLGPFQHYMTKGPGDAHQLTEQAVDDGAGVIVCIGGDGTLNEVVNGIMSRDHTGARVRLGFIPDGTGCDFVRTVPIPRRIEKAIDVIARGRSRTIDAGRMIFMDHDGRQRCRYFHNISSFGLGGEVDSRVNRTTKAFGPFLSFIWATLVSVMLYGKKRVRLEIDGKTHKEYNIWNVAVANGQYFGGGMWVAPDAVIDDGIFDITVVGDLSRAEVFLNLPKLYNGKIKTVEKVVTLTGKRIVATSNQRVLLDVDGEQPGTLPVVFDIVPNALTVISDR